MTSSSTDVPSPSRNRLQATNFEVSKTGANVIKKQFQYYVDGQLRYSQDQLAPKFDRSYSFDFMDRIVEAKTGAEARGQTEEDGNNRPYRESFGYDAFNHLNSRTTISWTQGFAWGGVSTWTNNRHELWNYDADGKLLWNGEVSYVYDAAARPLVVTAYPEDQTASSFDGDSQVLKQIKSTYNEQTQVWTPGPARYFIHSSVLNRAVVSETHPEGQKLRTFVYADGSVLAWQYKSSNQLSAWVIWEHRDPTGASFRTTTQAGQVNYADGEDYPAELDPVGADVQIFNPYIEFPPEPGSSTSLYPSYGTPGYQSTSYAIDGMPVTADRFLEEVSTWFGSGLGYAMLQSNVIRSRQIVGWRHLPRPNPRPHLILQGGPREPEWIPGQQNPENILGVLFTNEGIEFYAPIFNTSWAFSSTIIPQNHRVLLSNETVDTLRTNLEKFLEDKDCGKFINAVLSKLPKAAWRTDRQEGTLSDAFDRIRNDGGYWSKDLGGVNRRV